LHPEIAGGRKLAYGVTEFSVKENESK
jgi:hypothetical protein